MEQVSAMIATMHSLSTARLREIIAAEREAGRAFGVVAEAARTLYELRTGRKA